MSVAEELQVQSIRVPVLLQRLHPGREKRHLDSGEREAGEVESVEAQVGEHALSDEDKELLAFTNELRLDEAKRGGSNPSVELEEVALHGV